jgi:hypothetical protein
MSVLGISGERETGNDVRQGNGKHIILNNDLY